MHGTYNARVTVARTPSSSAIIDAPGQCAHPPATQREFSNLIYILNHFLSFFSHIFCRQRKTVRSYRDELFLRVCFLRLHFMGVREIEGMFVQVERKNFFRTFYVAIDFYDNKNGVCFKGVLFTYLIFLATIFGWRKI